MRQHWHFVWRRILQCTLTLFGGGVQVANITCVVFGAMSVGLLYLVVHGLMSLMLGLFDFSSLFENDGLEISRMAAIARVFSSAGLPFFERLEWHPTARFY